MVTDKPSSTSTRFLVTIDLTALGREKVAFETELSASWLKKPVRTALIEPLLASMTTPAGAKKMTMANVSDVLTQAKVPHAMRPSAFVIEREEDGCLLWVVGHKVSEHLRLDPTTFAGQPGLTMTFTPAP